MKAKVVIIGGGVIGLSIFSKLTEIENEVYLFEKQGNLALETSSHNSGVIHSGIHYQPGTLKAKLAVSGNKELYEICKYNSIECKRLGKLTVATNEEEIKILEKLYDNGKKNGVEQIGILDSEEINKHEPGVKALMALFTPTSGIIDVHGLCDYFKSTGLNNNGTIALRTEVTNIKKLGEGYEINGISQGSKFSIFADFVINAAGLYAHKIAQSAGFDIETLGYDIEYIKGDYYRVEGGIPAKMLVYPVPDPGGLGIHMTPDMVGIVRLGPNAYFTNAIDYKVETDVSLFIRSVKKYYPAIEKYTLIPEYSGIRPRLKLNNRYKGDFIIREETKNDFPHFINLIGIESPGLTASPAIGNYVKDLYLASR